MTRFAGLHVQSVLYTNVVRLGLDPRKGENGTQCRQKKVLGDLKGAEKPGGELRVVVHCCEAMASRYRAA